MSDDIFNWNDLPLLLAIGDTGSLAGAARSLGVNHSTVFRRLNAAEAALGTRVFERLPQGYLATELGADILEQARSAGNTVDALLRIARGADMAFAGEVRLTTALNLAQRYVPRALTALAERHPGIRVEVVVSDSDYDLARREADLALRAATAPPEDLVGRHLVDLNWWFCAHRRYLARRVRPERLEALATHRVIGADAGFRRLAAFRLLHENLPQAAFVATANGLAPMAALAREGLGIALLPSDHFDPDLERLFSLSPRPEGALWLLKHPDLRNVARIRAVAEVLEETVLADPALADLP